MTKKGKDFEKEKYYIK